VRSRALLTFGGVILAAAAIATPAMADGTGGSPAPQGSGSPQQPAPSDPQSASPGQPGAGQPGSDPYPAPGTAPEPPQLIVPGKVAKIENGIAAAPASAPPAVQDAIWTANAIVGKPYVYGGGHGAFQASGYDCSGSISYALHGGGLLSAPLDSSELESFGAAGKGHWITIFANGGHTYMNIAGIRLDTSTAGDRSGKKGPRWRRLRRSNAGYSKRHPVGL